MENVNQEPVESKKPSFQINDAKDETNALNKQQDEVEQKKESDPKTTEEKPQQNDTNQDDDGGPEKKKKSRAQKRIEKLAAEKRELQKQIAELNSKDDGKKAETNEVKDLDPDDFDDYDAYLDALDEQENEVKSDKKDKPKQNAQAGNSDFQELLDDIEIKFDDTREKYEDFDDLVTKPMNEGGPAISQTMLEAMNEFDNAGDVAYALATNVTESIRIANLKPMKQILEINKLSAKLSKEGDKPKGKEPQKKATNAPEPINVLGGGQTPTNSLSDAKSFADYQKLRQQQSRGSDGW